MARGSGEGRGVPGRAAPSLGVRALATLERVSENLLGDLLRARRARLSPQELGLRTIGRRRVPGLRREEVATAAGVSVDYYVRLEQGRERHPSVQVIDALAQALQLDQDGRAHLYRVAGLGSAPPAGPPSELADPELLRLLELWPDTPALVLGHAYDVLAANRLAEALFGGFGSSSNLLHRVFVAPDARTFYADWETVAEHSVAGFRMHHGAAPHDARIVEVLRDVLARSPEFARLWERHDARQKRSDSKRFCHPLVGELTLHMTTFDVRSSPGQELVVYHAATGSSSADALGLLRAVAVSTESR